MYIRSLWVTATLLMYYELLKIAYNSEHTTVQLTYSRPSCNM